MAEKDASARLRRAVRENNLFLVKRLIKRTDMRNPDPYNKRYTSLALAAELGHEETFEFLLSNGHDDHEYSKDVDDNTILILLAGARPSPSTPLSNGPSEQDFLGATLRMARMYLDRYVDVLDWANVEGKTALHVASLKGNEELVRMLCDLGADFDLADNEGNTPLHYASAWGHITIVQLLIERGCQYSARNNQGFTPSDYAYSISTRDTLQDTARIQFENNKRARKNVFQQAAARGSEWGGNMQVFPPSPREYSLRGNGAPRMRSGSGTSHTTTTSNSGDVLDGTVPAQSTSRFWSSPSRRPAPLPSGSHSPGQPSASSTSSTFGFTSSPISQPNSATLIPNPNSNPASALSPIATRMRERDAAAMETYKLRQRSGSATTASTDGPSAASDQQQASSPPPAPPPKDAPPAHGYNHGHNHSDDLSALSSLVTVGSVAPRRRLRPSASAAQLRSSPQPLTIPPPAPAGGSASQEVPRGRSGTSPAMLKPAQNGMAVNGGGGSSASLASPTSESSALPTPTQNSAAPPRPPPPLYAETYTGPPSEYARFPPPPASSQQGQHAHRPSAGSLLEEPDRAATPTTATAPQQTHSRRLPFNLLSSHKSGSMDVPGASHRRNASVNAVVR